MHQQWTMGTRTRSSYLLNEIFHISLNEFTCQLTLRCFSIKFGPCFDNADFLNVIFPHVGSNGCREPYAHASRSPFVRPAGSCLKYLLHLSSLVLHSTSVKTSYFCLFLSCPRTGIRKASSNWFAYKRLLLSCIK